MSISRLSHFHDTIAASDTVDADTARIELPEGGHMDGIVIFGNRRVKLTLTDSGAYELATKLADILDSRTTS